MKSIFMGSRQIFDVYMPETRREIAKTAGLEDVIYSKEQILASPESFKDTEYIFTTWGMVHFTEEEIKAVFPSLKCVFYGAGSVQHFAREFLNSGIKVFSAWGANAVPVAEYTVAQIILANKGYFLLTRRSRSFEGRQQTAGTRFGVTGNYNCTVGVIGAGMIGKLVINMLKSYKLNVVVYDPFLSEEKAKELGVTRVSLEELFANSQVITNHVANLPSTVGMLNYDLFKLMKDNAVFINTGRGAQVVEDDLIRILEEKPNITALLDVTMPEPPVEGSKFYTLENVFSTPHIAGSLSNEVARMGEFMLSEYTKYINNEPCMYEVTLKMLETMA